MAVSQLVFTVSGHDLDEIEAACTAAGAVSVTFADAADDPIFEPAPGETPAWPTLRVTALLTPATAAEAAAIAIASALGLSRTALALEAVSDRAWEREWLKDFRPMRFGRRLWVCPGGQRAPADDAVILELDPGLAFGTGTHATTALCLEWLDGAALEGARVLDYGCGSGILACAALALGAAHADAVDIDPQALLATRENAARNGLDARVTVLPADAPLSGSWQVVLANILAGPLVELAPRLALLTAPDGDLVLAGLLDGQADAVTAAYEPWFHMRILSRRDGWTALHGRRRGD